MAENDPTPTKWTTRISGLMFRKVAGVPVVVIVAIIAAGFLWWAIRMRPTETTLPDDATEDDGLAGDVDSGDQPTFRTSPAVYGSVTSPTVTTTQTTDTNELWARRVAEYYTANGYSVDEVQSMLAAYLNGESMNPTQATLRDLAVKRFGYPPENVTYAPIVTPETPAPVTDVPEAQEPEPTPPPASTPPPANPGTGYTGPAARQGQPPTTHTVRGTSDDSATELALLYFPNKDRNDARLLIRGAGNNMDIDMERGIPIGSKVHIPDWREPKYYTTTSATRTASQIAAKNGIDVRRVLNYNTGKTFPVAAGTRVRVG